MAIDVNSNKYTFGFAAVMVIVVASILAFASESLKDRQKANVKVEKMQNILTSVGYNASADEAEALYNSKLQAAFVLNGAGQTVSEDKEQAFNVDVQKDYRGGLSKLYNKHRKSLTSWDWAALEGELVEAGATYPLYKMESANGAVAFVVPMVGTGLWGPVWGYVAVGEDGSTIKGASFDHKTETPGLGAEINQASFQRPFIGKQLMNEAGEYEGITVMKGGAKGSVHAVDAISGGTITSNGVTEMLQRTLYIYKPFFASLKEEVEPAVEVEEEEVEEEEEEVIG
jgi:Na+-transporting NADH:ubiquinone oxidoreductase subunit C